jgi:hypothetical protein
MTILALMCGECRPGGCWRRLGQDAEPEGFVVDHPLVAVEAQGSRPDRLCWAASAAQQAARERTLARAPELRPPFAGSRSAVVRSAARSPGRRYAGVSQQLAAAGPQAAPSGVSELELQRAIPARAVRQRRSSTAPLHSQARARARTVSATRWTTAAGILRTASGGSPWPWSSNEPVVPPLRDWPVERRRADPSRDLGRAARCGGPAPQRGRAGRQVAGP